MRYYQVIEYVEALIRSEKLTSGSKLPSVRILSEELGCSKTTVVKAYETLVSNKIAYVIDKSGYYLMRNPEDMLISDQVDFSKSYLSPPLMDYTDVQQLFNKVMTHFKVIDDDIQGIFDFRQTMKGYFKQRKVFTNVHDMLITATKQEAMNLVVQRVCKQGEKILMESPSDAAAIELFSHRQNIITYSRVDEHIDFALLEYHIIKNRVKLIYITPYSHIPTGRDMSLEDKMQLLDICSKHEVYIIENNMYEDIYEYQVDQSLYALDHNDIVFHMKAFEHVFNPMFKTTVIVSPHNFIVGLKQLKGKYYGETSHIDQMILNEYLMQSNETKISDLLQRRMTICRPWIEQLQKKYTVHIFENALGFFIELSSAFNVEMMINSAKQKNIILSNCHHFFMDDILYKGLMISFTATPENELADNIKIIADYLLEL